MSEPTTPLSPEEIMSISGVIQQGHFVFSHGADGGDHGDTYINKNEAFKRPRYAEILAKELAVRFREYNIEVINSPVTAGVLLGQRVAFHLSRMYGMDVISVYSERADQTVYRTPYGSHAKILIYQQGQGEPITIEANACHQVVLRSPHLTLGRNFATEVAGKRVLLIDDVVRSAGTLHSLADATRKAGGNPVGAGVLWQRADEVNLKEVGIEVFHALVERRIPSWPAKKCPLCQQGVPIDTKLGKGLEFLASKGVIEV